MSKTALTNKVALARTGDKLKHWTQAIRDLYAELLDLKSGVVPEWHASPTKQYGEGSTFRYGHLRLLDKLLYQFKQNEDGTWWNPAENVVEIEGYRWNAVTWHGGLFVAVGTHGRIMTSVDGKTWDNVHWVQTPSTTADFEFFDVKWCGDMFIAVGSYNSFTYSYDGTYWHVPMYVGSIYDEGGIFRNANFNNLNERPSYFRATDAWKGVAYDKRTGVVMLCGTQCRTVSCRHVPTESVSTILFSDTVFHVHGSDKDSYVLHSIASKELEEETCFVACGNWNAVVQGSIRWDAVNPLRDIQWGTADESPITIEDNIHTIAAHTISEDTGWYHISVETAPDRKEYFVAVGSSGQSVVSLTGLGDSWNVPVYEDPSINTKFRCQTKGWNLSVAAGEWQTAEKPNITMYNDSVYTETESMEYGSSVTAVQHFTAKVDLASWYGAAFGNGVFVIAGDKNRLYWNEPVEEDSSGAALSVEFYKQYIAELQERVEDLESKLFVNDLRFVDLNDGTAKSFMWTDPLAAMFHTRGDVTINFISAPQYIYKEMMIYLEAAEDTTLHLGGAGEWENDLLEPEWGNEGSHLALKAIFIGSRVIVQIIDNDQLADNLFLLDEENQDQG